MTDIEKTGELPTDLLLAKRSLCDGMKADNVTCITVDYSGSGDDGQIDDVHIASNAVNRRSDLKFNFCDEHTVKKAARSFVYVLLEFYHGGWENNEGASGDVTINADTDTIVWEHRDYYQETNVTNAVL